MSDLNKAITVAATMHRGQYDKGGNPYVLHPLRIMLQAYDENARIVAVLHDIVEDTEITLNDLRTMGFNEDVITAIDCLTRKENETYSDFIQRIKQNSLAKYVKLLDLDDNKNLSRIPNPTQKDFDRVKKYEKAIEELMS